MSLLWINGTLADKLDARVSPLDHGLLYGDGVWEPLRLFNGEPFAAERALRTLWESASAVGIDIPLSQAELLAAINATATANSRTEGYVRVVVTRGPGTIGPDPRKIEPQVVVIVEEYQPFPHELYGHGLHVAVSPVVLDLDNPAHRHRTLNQLHVVQAKQHALRNGCLEALLQTRDGRIAGATEGGVFALKDGGILLAAGHGNDAAIWTAHSASHDVVFSVIEMPLTLADLQTADEVFVAGVACGLIGVVRIDGVGVGGGTEGPITREVREAYRRLTRGETK
ncbi:MAG: aminotransferase class IV [Gemmataceae bacterium]|nr:aminotransferase class IV [Gemmataceae bacterium]